MIVNEFYLSQPGSLPNLIDITDLSEDEIEDIVGRFKQDHWRFPGLLKGQVKVFYNGKVKIVHHFTKKKLWVSE